MNDIYSVPTSENGKFEQKFITLNHNHNVYFLRFS